MHDGEYEVVHPISPIAENDLETVGCVRFYPRPAFLARIIAWARSATCSLVKMLET
jgi:hypothetical protein